MQSHLLRDLLVAAGHQVTTSNDAGLNGEDDDVVMVITSNVADFLELHGDYLARKEDHPGILAVHLNNNPRKDTTAQQIVDAIAHVRDWQAQPWTAADFRTQFVYLNDYQ
jgi:hypothetical protein